MITTNRARLIAKDINSGPSSPLYEFWRQSRIDKRGILLEINDIIRYTNPKDRKRLQMLQEYILMK